MVLQPVVSASPAPRAARAVAHSLVFVAVSLVKIVLLARPCGAVADEWFAAAGPGVADAWYGAIAFSFQITLIFSGISDLIVALSVITNTAPDRPFGQPFTAHSITDFWQRWHLPCPRRQRKARTNDPANDANHVSVPDAPTPASPLIRLLITIAIVALLITLTHGPAWPMCIAVAFHIAMLFIERTRRARPLLRRIPWPIRLLITLVLVVFAWVFFRAPTWHAAIDYCAAMLGLRPMNPAAPLLHGIVFQPMYSVAMAMTLAWIVLTAFIPASPPRGDPSRTLSTAALVTILLVAVSIPLLFGWPHSRVIPGHDHWLFFEPDIHHLTGPGFLSPPPPSNSSPRQPDPIRAILHLKQQLDSRGISLIIVPAPVKPAIHPEMFQQNLRGPLCNRSFAFFKQQLQSHDVRVFDPTNSLATAGRAQYLATDTHWRPEAAERVASELARFVEQTVALPETLGVKYTRSQTTVRGIGDLAELTHATPPAEAVTLQPVLTPTREPWSARRDAEILWLGDSFSTIYAYEQMGFGSAAGIVEQFSYHLGRPVDAIRRNDNGAFATRQQLADELSRGIDRLAGKKLVIWQFAARELSFGDWQLIELKLRPLTASPFLVPPADETWTITGTVAATGVAPRPGRAAYRDHILAVHLVEATVEGRPETRGQAVVYLRSMIDAKLTDAASLTPGQRIRVTMRNWLDVSRQYELIARSDLPDTNLRTQPACWGELKR